MTTPELFRVDVVQDRPPSGMWHCGPNPSWVTVTHLPTMTQARAYHRSQHKARDAAMACVQMMIEDLLVTDDVCSFPEALAASPEVAAMIAEARREERERCVEIAVRHWEGEPEDTIAMAAEMRVGMKPLSDYEKKGAVA